MERRKDRGYYFDPTANDALADIARQEQHSVNPVQRKPDIYQASIGEITKFQGYTFGPGKLKGNNYFRKQMRRTVEERKKAVLNRALYP